MRCSICMENRPDGLFMGDLKVCFWCVRVLSNLLAERRFGNDA